METKPEPIFHLAFPEAWDAVQPAGEYLPEHYATDGFIHCSTATQLRETAELHFPDVDELRIINLDPNQLGEALKWEGSRNGKDFPHVYRAIRVPEDVQTVFTVSKNGEGKWIGWEALGIL